MGLIKPNHVYSYSQLTSAYMCPYMYYMDKIERRTGESNIFAEIGTCYHEVIDEWAKEEIDEDYLAEAFKDKFNEQVESEAPPLMAKRNYRENQLMDGVAFFENFDCFEGFEILGTEEKFKIEVGGRTFVGVVDMILQDRETGQLIICDHKSKSAKAFREAAEEMYRQQYLYSKYVYEQFGRYPDLLMFHLFKEDGAKICKRFDILEYEATLKWAEEVMDNIEMWEEYEWMVCKEQPDDGQPDFFCSNICSFRKECENGKKKYKPVGKRKRY